MKYFARTLVGVSMWAGLGVLGLSASAAAEGAEPSQSPDVPPPSDPAPPSAPAVPPPSDTPVAPPEAPSAPPDAPSSPPSEPVVPPPNAGTAEPPTAAFPEEPPPPALSPTTTAPPAQPVAPAPALPPTINVPPAQPVAPAPALPPTTTAPPAQPVAPAPVVQPKPAAQQPAAISPPPAESEKKSIFRVGPVVGVGIPNLLSFGGMLKFTEYLGVGLNVGLIPSIKLSFYGDATISYQEYDIYGRLFPFAGGFFLGTGLGYSTAKGTLKDSYNLPATIPAAALGIDNPLPYESRASVRTMVLTPQLGYFLTTDIGFSIGIDIGAQIPIAPSRVRSESSLAVPENTPDQVRAAIQTGYIDPTDKKVEDVLTVIGRYTLPTTNLRVGWLF